MVTRRSLGLFAGTGVVVVSALVISALRLGNLWSSGPRSAPARSSVSVQATPRQADQVAAALRKLATDPRSLVASGARPGVGGRARQAVAPGSTVVPDPRSWAPDGLGGGTMLVTITAPGRVPVSYYAVLVREAGQWKVLATIGLPAPVAASPGSPP